MSDFCAVGLVRILSLTGVTGSAHRAGMKRLALLLVGFLAGCASNNPQNLLVLGNSITRYGPNPSVGWAGDWGAAAPSEAQDFAHLTESALKLPVTVQNVSIETEPQAPLPILSITRSTVVVIELGDNAAFLPVPPFAAAYDNLTSLAATSNRFACTSTWWTYTDIDNVIQQACGAHRGHYVYIGDLRLSPENSDNLVVQFAFWGLNDHPRQWGHEHIAERVISALK